MDLLSLGLTNQAIAAKARLAEKAVRNYLTVVFEKLGVPHRAFAARAWRLLKSGSRGSTT